MRRLKILFPYTGGGMGGSHVSSQILADALRAAGHEVVTGLHRPGGAIVDFLAEKGDDWLELPDVPAPKLRAPWRQWWARRRVRQALTPWLAGREFDVVHSHDMRNHLIWSAALGDRPGGPAHVWHQRTPASGKHMAVYGRRADAFIAVSRFTLSSLPEPLRPHADMIYNPFLAQGKASAAARAALCADLGLAEGTAIVGFVANLSERKRPELFVEIAARVAAAYDGPLAFAIFGTLHEPFLTRVKARIAEHGLGERVHLVGPRRPFGPVMAGLTLLLAPARHEALGRTLIEAGMAQVPVVATREGGNVEIIEDGVTGRLVAADDAAAFAEATLEQLLAARRGAGISDEACARLGQKFSLETHLAAIEAVYARVTDPAG